MNKKLRHYEDTKLITAAPKAVFEYVDDHSNLSSHMNQSSWMMGGGKMDASVDEGKFQKVGSHLQMKGAVFGIKLFLDEVVTRHESPFRKEWQTVGNISLIVIDHYKLGFEIVPDKNNSRFTVFIDYEFPKSLGTRWIGYLFGEFYAKWCVKQMINGASNEFNKK
ncbi:MAG: SRPBCC family protein [Patescibacteria group bacterium]